LFTPGSNEQDIDGKMKQVPDRWPRKFRKDGVSNSVILRVRVAVLKNRSEVIGGMNEAIARDLNELVKT
jgi:hypothetical protein